MTELFVVMNSLDNEAIEINKFINESLSLK